MYSNPFLRAGVSAIALGLAFSSPAKADNENAENLGFILPPLVVTGNEDETVSYRQPGASTTLTEFDLERRDAYRASEALDSIPGVHFQPGNRGGGRNESSVYIRGFDLSRVPVLLDGIPIYVPYDGYIDLNRMMTFDLAAVEVARGYTSVLYGPNAM
ncbi:MAG TPA: TonB-dependent receptor, partial [Rhodobiaceae bacterium]|nr:TonB-dependent receptor [Rhodobiaceae bacterium]